MPEYIFEQGCVARYHTDEEKKATGFVGGDCMMSSITKLVELSNKFGNHFSLAMKVLLRETTSLTRLMSRKERKAWWRTGKYQIHFVIFNHKTKQYIDTSNGSFSMTTLEFEKSRFTSEYNRYHKIYHIPISYFTEHYGGNIGKFCIERLSNQNKLFTQLQERELIKNGVEIITG
tara:strand:+ start:990 stop:1514 length:525 start_codon:yes stop_codon:yes gene_type:complete